MKANFKIRLLLLVLAAFLAMGCFVSCDNSLGSETEGSSTEADWGEKNESVDNEGLVQLVNSESDLELDLLKKMTVEEIYEYEAEAIDGVFTVLMGESVHIDYDDRSEYEEYEWEYILTPYYGEDKGWYVTSIYTDSPYSRICGVSSGAGIEAIRSNYESKHFEVSVKDNRVVAKRGGITVTYVVNGEKSVLVSLVISKNDII